MGAAAIAKFPLSKVKQIVEMVRRLEDVSNARTLTALCARA